MQWLETALANFMVQKDERFIVQKNLNHSVCLSEASSCGLSDVHECMSGV